MSLLNSNLSDRLIETNRRVNADNRRKIDIQQDQDEDEMGYAYEEPQKFEFFNESKGFFANKDDENALNTAKSIFDKTAIFHVKSEE